MNRRKKLIFTISILLNIIFAGVGAGLAFKYCRDMPVPGDLSPEGQHSTARIFQEGRQDAMPLIHDLKKQRKIVEEILTADAFDAAAYKESVAALLAAQGKLHQHKAATMARAVENLSPEDRKKFARRIMDGLDGHRHKKKRDFEKSFTPKAPPEKLENP